MARGDLHRPVVAALVAIAALIVLLQGASAQTQCSATQRCAVSTDCCSQYNYCGTKVAFCGQGCQNGPCTGGTAPAPPAAGGSVAWSSFLTKAIFEKFFPSRDTSFYTYEAFKAAGTSSYSAFGTAGASQDDNKRELAAFLANINHESGGLVFRVEQNPRQIYCKEDTPASKIYPCAPGKSYKGRGPIQLSWNYNYGACGKALNLPLLTNPDLVAQDGAIAFKTALWFWMTTDCHGAILRKSFSGTIRAINSMECGQPIGSEKNNQMKSRVTSYQNFCSQLNVNPGIDLEC